MPELVTAEPPELAAPQTDAAARLVWPSHQPDTLRGRYVRSMATIVDRDGLAACRVRDVVRLARTSLRTFYDEFPSKEACFLAVHDLAIEGYLLRIRAAAHGPAAGADARSHLRDDLQRALLTALETRRLTYAILVEAKRLDTPPTTPLQTRFAAELRADVDRRVAAETDGTRSVPAGVADLVAGGLLHGVIEVAESGDLARLELLSGAAAAVLWTAATEP